MVAQVRPAQTASWLGEQARAVTGKRPLVLDVREPWELRQAAVAAGPDFDVRAIPMNSVPARLAELDPAQPLACLCHHGARSNQVAHFLERAGFERVANIAGGIDAWSAECDPSIPRY